MFILQCFLNIPVFDELSTSLLFAKRRCEEGCVFYFCQPGDLLSFLSLSATRKAGFVLLVHIQLFYSLCTHTHAHDKSLYPPCFPSPSWSREIFNSLIKGLDRVCLGFFLYSKTKYRTKGGQDVSNGFLLQENQLCCCHFYLQSICWWMMS